MTMSELYHWAGGAGRFPVSEVQTSGAPCSCMSNIFVMSMSNIFVIFVSELLFLAYTRLSSVRVAYREDFAC